MKLVSTPIMVRLTSDPVIRRVIAVLLVFATASMGTPSGFADETPSLNATPIQAKVRSIGLGEHVAVRMTSGRKYRGCITSIGPSSFIVNPHNGKPDWVVPYDDVVDVRIARSLLPWIIATAFAGTAVVIAIIRTAPFRPHNR